MHLALAEAQGAQAAPHLAVGSLLLSGVLPLLAVVVVAADIACLTINQSITLFSARAPRQTLRARASTSHSCPWPWRARRGDAAP